MSDALDLAVMDAAGPQFVVAERLYHEGLLDVGRATAAAVLDRARGLAENEMLRDVTGAWIASLHVAVEDRRERVSVVLSDDADYAGILEFGGRTRPHDIRPDDAEALRFVAGGGDVGAVFAAVIHDPGATIAPHPVLRTALADVAGDANAALETMAARIPAAAGFA